MKQPYVYVAFDSYKSSLIKEIKQVEKIDGDLIFSFDKINPCFAADVWLNPQVVTFNSINEAATLLLQQLKHWYLYPLRYIRRGKLIESKLKNPFKKSLVFPMTKSIPKTGVFCLLDNNTLLYSTERWKNIPFGLVKFDEDKINPPNRAYLKLWEALSFLNRTPKKEDTVIDLGASPGGWTYVLESLGAKVTAVDKAPLIADLQNNPAIHFLQQSAFSITPSTSSHYDWLCADIACYPSRLYSLILQWIESKKASHIICTLKFQGETDFDIIKKFQAIPGGIIIHLYYNKHEATFICPVDKNLFPEFR